MKRDGAFLLLALLFVLGAARKKVLSQSELLALARRVGFRDPLLAAAVAMAESGGNALAVGDRDKGGSYGLWQINVRAHPQYAESSLYDPEYNARAALAISKGGDDWHDWSAFNDGSYKRWMTGKGVSQ